jgi:hypothetical protein
VGDLIAVPRYLGRYLLQLSCGHYRGWTGMRHPVSAPCLQPSCPQRAGMQDVTFWKTWPLW